ncbi:Uncharacterized protein APZ42_000870, partial [Daphnia magna]
PDDTSKNLRDLDREKDYKELLFLPITFKTKWVYQTNGDEKRASKAKPCSSFKNTLR